MASGAAPQPRTLSHYKARAYLWWASFLEHRIAGRKSREAHKLRRDRAMRAAHLHGATLDDLAARTGLGPGYIRDIIRGKVTDD